MERKHTIGEVRDNLKALYASHGSDAFKVCTGWFSSVWLDIEATDKGWHVLVTSDENTHSLLGKAYSVYFAFDGESLINAGPGHLTGVYKSAISLWPVLEIDEIVEISEYVSNLVEKAAGKLRA